MTSLDTLAPDQRTIACLVSLAHLPGVGQATLRRCHFEIGAEAAWRHLTEGRIERVEPVAEQLARMKPEVAHRLLAEVRRHDPVVDLERQRRPGWELHLLGTPGYPSRLAADPEPPMLLFTSGHTDLLHDTTVAVVGTRSATLTGRELAEEMAADLVRTGAVIVSGLALGIDGAAHRGAVAASPEEGALRTVGVVASGLDVPYPRRHAELQRRIADRGLLVSETPAGIRPDPWRFPARNRIIAALADAVVVVESRAAGGSMHTVDEALARDVTVLAVPGHPGAPASEGTNALLFDGAGMARSAADVALAVGLVPPQNPSAAAESCGHRPPPSPMETDLVDALSAGPASLAELVSTTGRPVDEVAHALIGLEVAGRVGRSGAWYELTRAGRGTS